MPKREEKPICDLKPIIYKIRDTINEAKGNKRSLILAGVTRIYGYLIAIKSVEYCFDESFREHLENLMEGLDEVNRRYLSCRDPNKYAPTESEIEALEKEVDFFLSISSFEVELGDFLHAFTAMMQELEERMERGSPSLDDAYVCLGMVLAFDLVPVCHQMTGFTELVQNLEIYASSWPAKFAMGGVKEALHTVLKNKRREAA